MQTALKRLRPFRAPLDWPEQRSGMNDRQVTGHSADRYENICLLSYLRRRISMTRALQTTLNGLPAARRLSFPTPAASGIAGRQSLLDLSARIVSAARQGDMQQEGKLRALYCRQLKVRRLARMQTGERTPPAGAMLQGEALLDEVLEIFAQ